MVRQDVLPYVLVAGDPCKTHGLNVIGLKRKGFSEETVKNLRRAYYFIYRRGLTVPQSLEKLHEMQTDCPEVGLLIKSLMSAERGITR
jgi:UDP-N-acetylglucosamine acyltransferase